MRELEEARSVRRYTIYAVDFDGTLCEDKYPSIGKANESLIAKLIELREHGDKLILWTCRVGDKLEQAVEWCKEHGLEFDRVNENLPELMEIYGSDTRKISADVYLDDKALRVRYYDGEQ